MSSGISFLHNCLNHWKRRLNINTNDNNVEGINFCRYMIKETESQIEQSKKEATDDSNKSKKNSAL